MVMIFPIMHVVGDRVGVEDAVPVVVLPPSVIPLLRRWILQNLHALGDRVGVEDVVPVVVPPLLHRSMVPFLHLVGVVVGYLVVRAVAVVDSSAFSARPRRSRQISTATQSDHQDTLQSQGDGDRSTFQPSDSAARLRHAAAVHSYSPLSGASPATVSVVPGDLGDAPSSAPSPIAVTSMPFRRPSASSTLCSDMSPSADSARRREIWLGKRPVEESEVVPPAMDPTVSNIPFLSASSAPSFVYPGDQYNSVRSSSAPETLRGPFLQGSSSHIRTEYDSPFYMDALACAYESDSSENAFPNESVPPTTAGISSSFYMDALAAACEPGFSDDDDMAGFSVQDLLSLPQLADTSVGRPIYSIPRSSHVAPPAVSAFFQHIHRTPTVAATPFVPTEKAIENQRKRKLLIKETHASKRGRLSIGVSLLPADVSLPLPANYIAALKSAWPGRSFYGAPHYVCIHCGASFWYQERCKHDSTEKSVVYKGCCRGGKISLPVYPDWPHPLKELIRFDGDAVSDHFMHLIREYNAMFAFTSIGVHVDDTVNVGNGPYVFKICGVVAHKIGSLLPSADRPTPKFAQMYIYDTENELDHRMNIFDTVNNEKDDDDATPADGPSASVRRLSRRKERPDPNIVRSLTTMLNECNPLVQTFRMAQQRLISPDCPDVAIRLFGHEGADHGSRLCYHYQKQDTLRSETYQGISDALGHGDYNGRNIGVQYLLHSSFTGGRRYYVQNYHDGMAICRVFGAPDLFVTFTCNPKWDEITEALRVEPGQRHPDRPDITTRVFKLKIDEFIGDVKDGTTFGPIDAYLYVVEFQKRGLPHTHTLIWLKIDTRDPTPAMIDQYISAEIPDYAVDPLGYALVEEFMIHGPCGELNPDSPFGDGTVPMTTREGEASPSWICIPNDVALLSDADPKGTIIDAIYESFAQNYNDPAYLGSRAIVCPTNSNTDDINDILLSKAMEKEKAQTSTVSDITAKSYQCRLLARIYRIWELKDFETRQKTVGFGLTFVDQQDRRFKLKIEITEIAYPNNWWYMACTQCLRTTTPEGNSYKCPDKKCTCTEGAERYKLTVNAKDLEPDEDSEEVLGQFGFLGEHGAALTGYSVEMLIAESRARPGELPLAIRNVVGKKCIVVATVTQHAMDADNITFRVNHTEFISTATPHTEATNTPNIPASTELLQAVDLGQSSQNTPDGTSNMVKTPAKDVLEPTKQYSEEVFH
ncbi:hypothetical protein ACQ4PT_039955 [Festuca glaucescens]